MNSLVWGIVSVFGLFVGGFIVEMISWYWIFFINVLIGILLIIFIWLYLNELKIIYEFKLMDIFGSFSLMVMFVILLLGF